MAQEPLAASVPPERRMWPEPAAAVEVPPQLLARPLGVATTSPAGRESVNATPVRASDVLGLLMLRVNEVLAFSRMLAAPKPLVIVGGVATLSVAVLLVAPVPPLVELTAPVVLVTVPDCVPVTFTTIVHVLPGVAMLPPVRLMLVELAAAVTVPPQVLLTPGVDATCNPLVNVSLNAIPFSALVLLAGLVIVNVTVVVPFSVIFAAPNALLIVGGATTFSVAVLLVVPVPPSVELIAPVVLLASPSTVPFTSTLIVQDALWATLPPDRLIAPLPAVAVTVPPQVLVTLGVLDTTSVALPAPLLTCRVSLNATPVRSPLARVAGLFGLLMVKVTVVVPFSGMLPAPNALLIVAGATTVTVAVAGVLAPASVELTVTLLFLVPAVVPCTFTVNAQ